MHKYDWEEWCRQHVARARYDRGVMVGECEECHEPISAKSIYEGWANERRCAEHVLTAVFPKRRTDDDNS